MTLATEPTLSAKLPQPPLLPGRLRPRRAARLRDYANYGFLAPYLVLFTVFMLLPLGYGLWLSFMRYEMLSLEPPKFIGLAHYREALADPHFWLALWATLRFVIMSVPLTVALALILALAMNTIPDRRQNVYRLLVFLPTMITISVAGLVWRWLYNSEFGLFNIILGHFGWKVDWITDVHMAMKSIVIMTIWWTVGGPLIILLAGLRQIPDVYYEAAAIDGATGWRRTFYITLPILKPILLFVIVLNVIGAFQIFGQPYIITSGGPERSTYVLMMYIYETSFLSYRLGYGAAMSWILFLLIAGFSIVQFRLMKEE